MNEVRMKKKERYKEIQIEGEKRITESTKRNKLW